MKNIQSLLDFLSKQEEFPVKIETIVKWFSDNGFQDQINLYPVPVQRKIVSAYIVRWKKHGLPYTEAERIADIYYSIQHDEDWARLMVCKELMHMFDKELEAKSVADDPEKIKILIRELIDHRSFVVPEKYAPQTHADMAALGLALMVLVPYGAVEELLEGNVTEMKTKEEVADLFKIPVNCIDQILNDKFLDTHLSVKHEVNLHVINKS